MSKIVPQSYEVVSVGAIRPHPSNPNKGDVESIGESIGENDFFGACLVQRSTGFILAGTHRWIAAKSSGLLEVPVLWVEVTDEHALRILLADNGTSRKRAISEAGVAHILKRLGSPKGTGYSLEEQERFIASIRPSLGYLDTLSAATDEDMGEPMNGAVEPDASPAGPANADARHALPIVLTNAEKRAWDDFKKRIGVPKDKAAFLQLLAAAAR